MEQEADFRKQIMEEYKTSVVPLLNYLPWLEQHSGQKMYSVYRGDGIQENSLSFPVYDGTLMRFLKQAEKTTLMDRNYRYVYTRNRIKTHEDERNLIQKATWRDWNNLRGILSKYVMGGRTKSVLWNEAVKEGIFLLTLKQMKEIIEFWDKPIGQ